MSLLRRCLGRWVPAMVAVALVAVACSSTSTADDGREVDTYEAILRWLVDYTDRSVGAPSDGGSRLVFVDHLGPDKIALDIQVELVVRLADHADLRFIDSLEEAVDVDLEDRPVRDGGVLVGLGLVPDETPIEARGEVYLGPDEVHGWRFPMILRNGRWELRADPEVVDPEGFVETP